MNDRDRIDPIYARPPPMVFGQFNTSNFNRHLLVVTTALEVLILQSNKQVPATPRKF